MKKFFLLFFLFYFSFSNAFSYKHIFKITKNIHPHNIVYYDVILNNDCTYNKNHTFSVYWQLCDTGNCKIEPPTYLENKLAYKIIAKVIKKDVLAFKIVALPKQWIYVKVDKKKCKVKTYTFIRGKKIFFYEIYAYLKKRLGLIPYVAYIIVKGYNDNGKPIQLKLTRDEI